MLYSQALLMLVLFMGLVCPALALPTANEALSEMDWSDDEKQRILAGEFVTGEVKTVSDRDLSLSMGFLVKTSPDHLAKQVVAGELMKADPQIKAHGTISGDGSIEDFQALKLATAEEFLKAKPGNKLNLTTKEITAFTALKGKPNAEHKTEEQLRKMMLTRYRDYRRSGLTGISPYDRGKGKNTEGKKDLLLASESARVVKKYLPSFYKVMSGYPQATIPDLDEHFAWIQYDLDGKPNYVLTHFFSAAEGDARIVVQRQFYVANTYNVMQSVAGFLPVKEGTLVVYVNHTSTDQVAGFGGSAKRDIGRRIMAKKLEEGFKQSRAIAEQ